MIIIGIILGLLLLLVLVLPYLLDLNRYREQYIPVVERVLNRKVEISHIRVMWFPNFGIRIEGAKIFDIPGMNQSSFIEVSSIELAVKWKPLLQRRVEVESLALHQPIITLIRTKDGSFNTATLGVQKQKSRGTSESDDSGQSLLAMLGVEQLTISEGTIQYEDRSREQAQTYQLKNFHMQTKSVRLGDTAKISAHGTLIPYQLPVVLEGSLGPLQENFDIPHIETMLKIGNSGVSAKGQAIGGMIDLDVTSSKISFDDLPLNVQLNTPVVVTKVFAHVQAPTTEEKKPTSSQKELTVSPFRFHVEMGKSIFMVSGQAVGRQVEIHGTSPAIHSSDLPVSLLLKNSVSVSDFDVKATINGLLVHVEALTGEVFGGHLTMNGMWDGRSAVPMVHSSGRFQEFRVEEVQKILEPAAVTLHGSGDINWNMKGTLPLHKLPLLTGRAELMVSNGQVKGFDLLQRIEEVLKLKGLLSTGQGVTSFSKFTGEVEFQEERFPIKAVLLEGHEKEFLMQGAGVVMRDQSIKVNGNLRLGKKVSEKIIQQMPVAKVALQEGDLVVPFAVKGSLSQPTVGLDFGSIQKRLQKQVGEAVEKILQGDSKDVQEILKKGKSLLKGLFGK